MKEVKKQLRKVSEDGSEAIRVRFGISVTNHAYFSVTADVAQKFTGTPSRMGEYMQINKQVFEIWGGGCMHDKVLEYFPEMADIVALHLSDIDGMPMYAVENGWYHITREFENGCKYLRLSKESIERLKNEVYFAENSTQTMKGRFEDFIESMKPIWKAEADAVIEKYDLKQPEE